MIQGSNQPGAAVLAPTTAAWPAPGSVVDGRYRLERCIGAGSAGRVYAALHLGLRTHVAVKLLHPSGADEQAARVAFEREAEALGRLAHPHIVRVLDFGQERDTGRPFLAMELLTGCSLAQWLHTHSRPDFDQTLVMLEQVARALDAAHAAGLLHRDIKPANVWLDETGVIKVMDFGLARRLPPPDGWAATGAPHDQTDGALGTPLYAAPEILRGTGGGTASDVYSFGVLAYEMLTGQPPFNGSVRDVLDGHLQATLPRAPTLAPALYAALAELLAKQPVQRPATAGLALQRLRLAVAQARHAAWQRRRAQLALGVMLALLAAAEVLPSEPLPAVERHWHDLRLRLAPRRDPDARLLLVALEPEHASPAQATLAERAEEIAPVLSGMLAAGARGVALDLLLPGRWSTSPAFSRLVLTSGDALTLAAFAEPDGRISGTDAIAGLTAAALGPRRAAAPFGLVNLDEDPDGSVRRGRFGFRHADGQTRPAWASHATAVLVPAFAPPSAGGYWIDFRLDERRVPRWSWRAAREALAREPLAFRERLVLVGANWTAAADDYHRVPGRSVSGLELQALQVATLLAGPPLRTSAPRTCTRLAALLAGAVFYLCLGWQKPRARAAPLVVVALVWLVASAGALLVFDRLIPATTPWPFLALGAFALWIGGARLRPPREGG